MDGTTIDCSGNTCTVSSDPDTLSRIREAIFGKLCLPPDDGIREFRFEINVPPAADRGIDPSLTPFQRRCACYLSVCPEIPIFNLTDVSKIPEMRPEHLGLEIAVPPLDAFVQEPLEIHEGNAVFLVEIYATNQSPNERCSFKKDFMRARKVYRMCLLPEYPICFEHASNGSARITFADTNVASAKEIRDQFVFAMNVFNNAIKLAMGRVTNVERSFDLSEVQKIADELNYAVLCNDYESTSDGVSFNIYCMPRHPGIMYRKVFANCVEKVFQQKQLYVCTNCGQVIGNDTMKTECVLRDEEMARNTGASKEEEIVFLNGHSKSPNSLSSIDFNLQ